MLVVTRPTPHFGNRKLRFTRSKLRDNKLSPAWDDLQSDAAVPVDEEQVQRHGVTSLEKLCAESVWAHRDVFCKLPHKDGSHPLQLLPSLIKTLILDQALDNINLQGIEAFISDSDIIKCSILKGFLLHSELSTFELPICLTEHSDRKGKTQKRLWKKLRRSAPNLQALSCNQFACLTNPCNRIILKDIVGMKNLQVVKLQPLECKQKDLKRFTQLTLLTYLQINLRLPKDEEIEKGVEEDTEGLVALSKLPHLRHFLFASAFAQHRNFPVELRRAALCLRLMPKLKVVGSDFDENSRKQRIPHIYDHTYHNGVVDVDAPTELRLEELRLGYGARIPDPELLPDVRRLIFLQAYRVEDATEQEMQQHLRLPSLGASLDSLLRLRQVSELFLAKSSWHDVGRFLEAYGPQLQKLRLKPYSERLALHQIFSACPKLVECGIYGCFEKEEIVEGEIDPDNVRHLRTLSVNNVYRTCIVPCSTIAAVLIAAPELEKYNGCDFTQVDREYLINYTQGTCFCGEPSSNSVAELVKQLDVRETARVFS